MLLKKINSFTVMILSRAIEPFLYNTLIGISKIREVKIIRIYSSRVGHLCWNIDNYKKSLDDEVHTSSKISIFVLDKTTANGSVLELIRKDLPGLYIKGQIAVVISRIIVSARWKKFCVPWEVLHPKESKLANTPKWVRVPKNEIEDFLKKHELENKKSVVFHNRDRAYLDSIGGDSNFHDYRDFSFQDYSAAIETLKEKDIKAIRIGKEIEKSHTAPNLLDLTGNRQNFWGDIVAVEVSQFFVSGNSGVGHLSNLLRKPHLFVNQIPFDLHHLSSFPQYSIFMPKKLRDMSNGNILSFKDSLILLSDWSIHSPDFFSSRKLEVINNTAEEISSSVVEMLQRTSKVWKDHAIDSKICETLEYMYKDNFAKYIFHELGIKLSSNFVKSNYKWFFDL